MSIPASRMCASGVKAVESCPSTGLITIVRCPAAQIAAVARFADTNSLSSATASATWARASACRTGSVMERAEASACSYCSALASASANRARASVCRSGSVMERASVSACSYFPAWASASTTWTRARLRGGVSAFGYSDSGARTVHPALNPYGVGVRESRDSAEHPASLTIAVPRKLQAKLPQLLGLLLRKGYAPTAWCSASDRRRRPRVLSRRGRRGGRCAGS